MKISVGIFVCLYNRQNNAVVEKYYYGKNM